MLLDRKFQNVLLLSIGSLFLMSAIQTTIMIQKTITKSISAADADFTVDGYTSLGLMYTFFALGSWFTPSVISLLTPKWTIVLSVVTYALFIASYLRPIPWVVYSLSAVLGLGSALYWAGQGTLLSLSSDKDTIVRNSGIFRAAVPMGLLSGNLLVFFAFEGQTLISPSTRIMVFSILIGFCAVGFVIFLFLRHVEDFNLEKVKTDQPNGSGNSSLPKPSKDSARRNGSMMESAESNDSKDIVLEGPVQAFLASLKLLRHVDMMLLCTNFICLGLSESFCFAVYSAAVGFTLHFGEGTAKYVGICGMLFAAGGTLGGLIVGFLGKKVTDRGRCYLMVSGTLLDIAALVVIFCNLPDNSVFGPTSEDALMTSNLPLALACCVVLGIGDAFIQSMVYAILGSRFADRSSQAFAIFKFCEMLASAVACFYSSHVGLRGQVAIFAASCVAAAVTFCVVIRRGAPGPQDKN